MPVHAATNIYIPWSSISADHLDLAMYTKAGCWKYLTITPSHNGVNAALTVFTTQLTWMFTPARPAPKPPLAVRWRVCCCSASLPRKHDAAAMTSKLVVLQVQLCCPRTGGLPCEERIVCAQQCTQLSQTLQIPKLLSALCMASHYARQKRAAMSACGSLHGPRMCRALQLVTTPPCADRTVKMFICNHLCALHEIYMCRSIAWLAPAVRSSRP